MEQHWCDIRYAGFLKLIAIFANAILSRTQRVHVDLFFFSKSNEWHKFALFYQRVTMLRDSFQTGYH